MTQEHTATAAFTRSFAEALVARGVDVPAALRAVKSDPLISPEARTPSTAFARAMEEEAERRGDPMFGLHLATSMPASIAGVIHRLLQTSVDAHEALVRASRYFRLITTRSVLVLEEDEDRVVLTHRLNAGQVAGRQVSEFILAFIVARSHELVSPELAPSLARFAHPAPDEPGELERFFGCTVEFSQPNDELHFDARWLASPLQALDDLVGAPAERPVDFVDAVRHAIEALLPSRDLGLDALARQLGISGRTLQRRLQTRNILFADLADEVRRDLAMRRLRDTDRTIADVAHELGFSGPEAFHRAFRRWTGTTPSRYRQTGQLP